MSAASALVVLLAVAQLGRAVIGPVDLQCLDRVLWLITAAAVIGQIIDDGVLLTMVSAYVLLLFLAAIAVRRTMRGEPNRVAAWRRVGLRAVVAVLSLPLLGVPLVDAVVVPLHHDDVRDETWSDAFDHLHNTLRRHYPLGRWKRVNWDQLVADHRPAVAKAERDGDTLAYYRAIRAYVSDIPDGHLSVDGPAHPEARLAEIGGGFGFTLLGLDDDRFIAHVLKPGGPAAAAGMTWGAEVLAWNGQPIDAAIANTSTVWALRPPATEQTIAVAKQQLLTRAPVGAASSITFRNQSDDQPTTVTLIAVDDGYGSLVEAERDIAGEPSPGVANRWLGDGIGYLRLSSLEATNNGGADQAMERAMKAMANAEALILETRGNRGGPDELVPKMMSPFTRQRLLYEHVAVPNPLGEGMIRLRSFHVEPSERPFTGPIVVLIDHRTKSSGEGFALIAKQLPNAVVIGSTGTDGSFAMVGESVFLPTGIEVTYPWGISVDDNNVVQVDGDHGV